MFAVFLPAGVLVDSSHPVLVHSLEHDHRLQLLPADQRIVSGREERTLGHDNDTDQEHCGFNIKYSTSTTAVVKVGGRVTFEPVKWNEATKQSLESPQTMFLGQRQKTFLVNCSLVAIIACRDDYFKQILQFDSSWQQ